MRQQRCCSGTEPVRAATLRCRPQFADGFKRVKTSTKWIISVTATVALATATVILFNWRGQTDIRVADSVARMQVTSPAFENLGAIPDEHTGRGEDSSPQLELTGLTEDAGSIAIIMDDLDVPWRANYTHWVIWDVPPAATIPAGISAGAAPPEVEGAVQGVGFGRNRYRGPAPPFGTHRYQFHVFVLDSTLKVDASGGKDDLLRAMEGHVLQYGSLIGWYPTEAN